MLKRRQSLPSYKEREHIINTIRNNQVGPLTYSLYLHFSVVDLR
jgi:hypothetical protein